jgi:hypothetical protein
MIKARAGRFSVSAKKHADGVALRISNTTWDGEKLRFVSIYPPARGKGNHEFWLIGKGRARHKIQYSGEDGNHTAIELWKRSRSAKAKSD